MYQTKEFTLILQEGDRVSIPELDRDDINYYYSIHTVMFLGNYEIISNVKINGNVISLPGGSVYNQTPVRLIEITTAPNGVLVIGKKTRKKLFNPLIVDLSVNDFMGSDYVDDYFE